MSKRIAGTTQEDVQISRTRLLPVKYRVLPYLTPWALGLITLPLGAALHWKASSAVMMIVVTACAGILTWATYRLWDRRHVHTQRLATAYAGIMSLWLVITAAVGVSPMLTTWAIGWAMTSLLWNIRLGSISVTNKHDKIAGQPETAWEPIRGLKGVKTKFAKLVTTDSGHLKAKIRLQHPPGQSTTDDVQAVRDNIAGRFAVDPDDVIVQRVKGRGDQTDVEVMADNPTSNVVEYTGLTDVGKSIMDAPVRIGVRASGKPFAFWIVGDDRVSRPTPHTLTSGMNGTGKSEAMIVADLQIRARIDALSVVANPAKFMIDFGDVADMYPIAAEGEQQTRQLIDNLPETGEYRAWLLGKLGYKQWVPECYLKHGIPLVFIRIEEAASVLAGNKPFKRATETFRALGMPLCASMQVAVFRNIDREARSQFGNSLAFGVTDEQDANFVLTKETMQAGAKAIVNWKNNEAGRLFAELTGFPKELWSERARVWKITREQKRAAIEMTKPHWAQLDAGTAMRLGKGIMVPDATIIDRMPTLGPVENIRPIMSEAPTVPNLSMIPGGKENAEDGEKLTTAEVREITDSYIDDLEAERTDGVIKANDFKILATRVGRTLQWVYWELDRRVKIGDLEKLPQEGRVYRIIPRDQRRRA